MLPAKPREGSTVHLRLLSRLHVTMERRLSYNRMLLTTALNVSQMWWKPSRIQETQWILCRVHERDPHLLKVIKAPREEGLSTQKTLSVRPTANISHHGDEVKRWHIKNAAREKGLFTNNCTFSKTLLKMKEKLGMEEAEAVRSQVQDKPRLPSRKKSYDTLK